MKKIVFYGASVTQQSSRRDGVLVGYVSNVIQFLLNKFGADQFDFYQMGFGSNHFNDAGFIMFDKVLEIKPDIVVMEWHTTGIGHFDPAKYDYVIRSLLKTNCKIVSLVLPFRRCVGQTERDCVKQSRWYQRLGLIQLNFYPLIGYEIDLDMCLRDEVHTNENGGNIYGKIIARTLVNILRNYKSDYDVGDEIEPKSDYKQAPPVSSFAMNDCNLNHHQVLVVNFRANGKIQLFADSIVGPFSPVVHVKCGKSNHTISLWDQWCRYERKCLKPLSLMFDPGEQTVTLSISTSPIVDMNYKNVSGPQIDIMSRIVKNIESIYLVGGEIMEARIEKRVENSKIRVFIFANCHGALYKSALIQADKEGRLEIEHIVSYENISNFDKIKDKFSQCDILIIQPIQNYEAFKLENIIPLLKSDCTLIRIPFIRFQGFWDVKDERKLSKFTSQAVMFFPNIFDIKDVPTYLRGEGHDEQDIVKSFDIALEDFRMLESQGDIMFFDFFTNNYKNYPLFRDPYHPTRIFYDYISNQLVGLVKNRESSLSTNIFEMPIKYNKEYGHFKPISDKTASALSLKFDLNSYFQFTRYHFMTKILAHENDSKTKIIHDLQELKNVLELTHASSIQTQASQISLFLPYFKSKDECRQQEFISCLQKNSANPAIDRIYLLVDDNHVPEVKSAKIEIISITDRPTYSTWLRLTQSKCTSGISILANTDILFDESIIKLPSIFATGKEFVALSRYEKSGNDIVLHKNPHWSQDVWAISAHANITDSLIRMSDFKLGIPRCDNKIAYCFSVNGFRVYNPCHDIKTVHLHQSALRNYNKRDMQLVGMIAFVYPCFGLNIESQLDHQLWALNSDQIERVTINKHLEIFADKPTSEVKRVTSSGGKVIAYNFEWQYPAITEQHAYLMIKNRLTDGHPDAVYFGFPWATLIDRLLHAKNESSRLMAILHSFANTLKKYKRVVTVCQHIHMLRFQDLFYELGVTDIFWSHCIRNQDSLPKHPSISLSPFPLYPVQHKKEAGSVETRSYLYSFVGAKSKPFYLTDSRNKIIDYLTDDVKGYVRGREEWHYNKIVYAHQIKQTTTDGDKLIDDGATQEFKRVLENSIFSLCPSGSGPNSIRLWESLSYGSIPVILADTYLPPGNPNLWEEAVVFCEETEEAIKSLPARLETLAKDNDLLARKRHAARQLWHLYGPDCFIYDIQKLFIRFANDNVKAQISWKNLTFENLALKISDSDQQDVQAMQIFLMSICSRLLTSPDHLSDLYLNNIKVQNACRKSLHNLPASRVEPIMRIADYRNFKFV